MSKRTLPLAAAVMLCSIAFAGSALAQGEFPPPPGHTQSTDTAASAELSDSTQTIHAFASVDRGTLSFKPKQASGPPIVTGPATMLNLEADVPNGFAHGCWIIPDTEFTVASGLTSATLSATVVPGVSECPGPPVSAGTGARPGLEALSLLALQVGPQGSFGFIGPVQISVTWTFLGTVATSQFTDNESCASFFSHVDVTAEHAFSKATASLTATIATFKPLAKKGQPPSAGPPVVLTNQSLASDFAVIEQDSLNQVISGTLVAACNPFMK